MDGDTKHGPDRVEDDDPLAVQSCLVIKLRPDAHWHESKTNIPSLSNKQRIFGVATQQFLAVAQPLLEAFACPSAREHRTLEECARVEQ